MSREGRDAVLCNLSFSCLYLHMKERVDLGWTVTIGEMKVGIYNNCMYLMMKRWWGVIGGCWRKACGVPGNNFRSSLIIERSIWRIGGSCTVPGGEWGHFLSFARHYFRFEWKNVPCNFLIEFRRLLCQCLVSDYCCALSGVESFGWKWHLREAAAGEQFRALVRDSCGSETVGDADNDLERRHWRWLRSWCHSSSLIETSSVKTRGHLKQEMDYIESSTERYLTVRRDSK